MQNVVFVDFSKRCKRKDFPKYCGGVISLAEYRKVRKKELNRLLIESIMFKDRELFEESLQKGASVEAKDSQGWTALYLAVWKSNYEFMEALLKAGANPNKRTDFQDLPLCVAAEVGDLEAIDILLKYGANPALKRKDAKNPDHKESPAEILIRDGSCFIDGQKLRRYLEKLEAAN